jgi:hypothetical protein
MALLVYSSHVIENCPTTITCPHGHSHGTPLENYITTSERGIKERSQDKSASYLCPTRRCENLANAKFTKLIFAQHCKTHFIGGGPMQRIPLSHHLSVQNQAKCVYYTSCQGSFLSEIKAAEIVTILDIDSQVIGLNGCTLRQLILVIPL